MLNVVDQPLATLPDSLTRPPKEVLDGQKWRTVTAGQVIGHKQLRRFSAVTARRVRLVIDQAAAQRILQVPRRDL